jgi:hypothetical protein
MKAITKTWLIAILAVLGSASTVLAQEDDTAYIQLRMIQVQPGKMAEFQAAILQIREIYREAGYPYYHIYQGVRNNVNQFVEITPDAFFNDVPGVQLPPELGIRVTSTMNSMNLVTLAVYPQLSSPGDGVAPSGEFMTVRLRTTSPQNQQAFFDWHASEFTPALREAGWRDVRVGRIVAGGNINTFVKFTYSDQIPPNNGDVLGRMNIAELIDGENALTVSAEDYVDRYRADLSYTAD